MSTSQPAAPSSSAISQASAQSMAQAELAGASSIGLVMFNAAQAQQACQQIELSVVGVVCAQIVAAIV
ncbi:MAG: hypothetical protein JWQ42_4515 [Edaphobacter sp.]|jgi:hypothetical protein|nr:hypothetical protein [Edaphobacter sp.]